MTPAAGLRANARQIGLLAALTAVIGATAGLERSVLPLVGEREFGLESRTAILSFLVAFGLAKACANLAAGRFAERSRKRTLVAGWLLVLPAAPLIGLAPSWHFVVAANLFLGAAQGLVWSMAVLMKIDVAGPRRRGLVVGLNESAGYLGVAGAALATGLLAATVAPRTLVWTGVAVLAAAGFLAALLLVEETQEHREERGLRAAPSPRRVEWACAQAGHVTNLGDAVVWGLVPLFLAAHGAGNGEIAVVAALYPAVWGAGQLGTGWLSDLTGRKAPIVTGMLLQAVGLGAVAARPESIAVPLVAAVVLGAGTALVYPTLLAAVGDAAAPGHRARSLGRYRFWRDGGLVVGALAAGALADLVGAGFALFAVAAVTAVSGIVVATVRWPGPSSATIARMATSSLTRW